MVVLYALIEGVFKKVGRGVEVMVAEVAVALAMGVILFLLRKRCEKNKTITNKEMSRIQ